MLIMTLLKGCFRGLKGIETKDENVAKKQINSANNNNRTRKNKNMITFMSTNSFYLKTKRNLFLVFRIIA